MDTEAEATWTRLSTSNIKPPKSILDYKISSIKSKTREKGLDTEKNIPDLNNTKHRINHIGTLIQEIDKVISETKNDLLDIEARFGGNIKFDVSWTLLAYATFSAKLIFTAPYKDRQEIYRSREQNPQQDRHF